MSHTNALGVQISKNCSDTLLQYGLEALTSAKNHQVSEALEQVVLTYNRKVQVLFQYLL